MYARKLRIGERKGTDEQALFFTVQQWNREEQRQELATVGFALDRQALTAFRERIKAGMKGVIALGNNRDCRVDLTQVKVVEEGDFIEAIPS